MPTFKPFRGVRPSEDYIRSFPTYSLEALPDEAIAQKSQEENTYINMVKPFVLSKSKDIDRNLRKIRANYEELLNNKVLVQDTTSYYLYEQILPDKSVFRGLLGLVSVEDFLSGKIKKHESTFTEKKEQLAHYLDKVNIQAEPVLLTYNPNSKVELLMNHEEKNVPVVNYTSENGTKHKIWRIDNRLKMQQLKEVLEQIECFYIADGHHRMGSTALSAKNKKEKDKKHNGTEAYNYVYAYVVSKESIKINDYNRILKDLHGLSTEEFLKKLEENFLIHEKGTEPYYPSKKFHISMYLDGKFYSLHVKHDIRKQEHESNRDFDHYLLEKYILDDILKIDDYKTTDRITYVQGDSSVKGILKLKEMIDSGEYRVGFGVYPLSFNDLIKISDLEIKMPPKCSLIEPKLITAQVMYDMK